MTSTRVGFKDARERSIQLEDDGDLPLEEVERRIRMSMEDLKRDGKTIGS